MCSDEAAAASSLPPLFAQASARPPIVQTRDGGVLVTRGAGRVRGRHELEGTFSPYGPLYFEHRSYGFEIEDHVAAGSSRIVFTYRPEADVSQNGPGTNFRYFKIYGDGNVFHSNVTMQQVTPRELTFTVERNAREGRELRAGDLLEFEFGIFIAGQSEGDPGAIEGRTSYYSDTFRYRVGQGGLSPDSADPSGDLGPGERALLGGATTIPWIYAEPELYFSQLALNVQPDNVQAFLRGRRLFHTDFGSGEHGEPGNPAFVEHAGKLGPGEIARACTSCHDRDGRGPAAATGEPARVAPQLPGMGLLEAIDERAILARADEADCDGDGISGRAQRVVDPESGEPRLGRFGWKAEKVSVAHQVASALAVDLGVTTELLPGPGGESELAAGDFDDLVAYTRLLGLPAQRNASDPQVVRGQALFGELGCDRCHVPEMTTGDSHPYVELRGQRIRPYTDLLVHDMGPELADDTGSPEAGEWRTPPLWGLGLIETVSGRSPGYLHDGRASTPLQAVMLHGGEAEAARDAAMQLAEEDRAALEAFLRSL